MKRKHKRDDPDGWDQWRNDWIIKLIIIWLVIPIAICMIFQILFGI